ncbi:MAG TPA: hypothetical protein VFM54_01460 [Micromonosporaceae bacterium]|nr:hypothetical protein [Micromonosporaceae bacterium]
MDTRPGPPSGPTPPHPSGAVTRLGAAPEPVIDPFAPPPPPSPADQRRRQRRTLLLFGGSAAGVALVGVVTLLLVVLGGADNPLRRRYPPLPDDRPPLAQLCPPPSQAPGQPASPDPPAGPPPSAPPASPGPTGAVPAPTGGRTVDAAAGISYRRYGEPWVPWRERWTAGTLEVSYLVGQHFVTEVYSRGTYHASILSASVPAAVNDALSIDLACTGRQVAADVRAEYYPQPNRMELLRDERSTVGGRPAWVTKFRLHFSQPDLKATSELVAVALIDVGRPDAAVFYVSIPNTHSQLDWVVDDALASVQVP